MRGEITIIGGLSYLLTHEQPDSGCYATTLFTEERETSSSLPPLRFPHIRGMADRCICRHLRALDGGDALYVRMAQHSHALEMNSLTPRRRCGVVGGTKMSGPTSSISTVAYRAKHSSNLESSI
jgi:hypothetical protein